MSDADSTRSNSPKLDAAQRRELRRQKILERGTDRLKQLTQSYSGVAEDGVCGAPSSPALVSPSLNSPGLVSPSLNSPGLVSQPDSPGIPITSEEDDPPIIIPESFPSIISPQVISQPPRVTEHFETILRERIAQTQPHHEFDPSQLPFDLSAFTNMNPEQLDGMSSFSGFVGSKENNVKFNIPLNDENKGDPGIWPYIHAVVGLVLALLGIYTVAYGEFLNVGELDSNYGDQVERVTSLGPLKSLARLASQKIDFDVPILGTNVSLGLVFLASEVALLTTRLFTRDQAQSNIGMIKQLLSGFALYQKLLPFIFIIELFGSMLKDLMICVFIIGSSVGISQ
ncbi:hypothetical protein HK096_002041, partial [Nowakowskiella sp. JEL0078]